MSGLMWAWIIMEILNILLYEVGAIDLGQLLILFLLITNVCVTAEVGLSSFTNEKRSPEEQQ